VRNIDTHDLERGRALLGRARARYRLQRVREALADLDDAVAIAVELGDARLEIEALLEQATALDWSEEFTRSAAITERALARHRDSGDPDLGPEIAFAHARMLYRQTGPAAVPLLAGVVEQAIRAGHQETETIARLLLAPALVEAKRLDAAEAAFEQLIELCRNNDDRLHFGAAVSNRMVLWGACGQLDRIEADLRTVIQLARETGQVMLERGATHNLAEHRLWQDALGEALTLARRGLSLQLSHAEGATAVDELLLARVLAARGELDETRSLVARLAAIDLAPEDRIVVEMLRCFVDGAAPSEWQPWLERADAALSEDVVLELSALAKQRSALSLERLAHVRLLARRNSMWSRRQF
jgi:tetratricopeptide (TPR) repeat protein